MPAQVKHFEKFSAYMLQGCAPQKVRTKYEQLCREKVASDRHPYPCMFGGCAYTGDCRHPEGECKLTSGKDQGAKRSHLKLTAQQRFDAAKEAGITHVKVEE